MPLFLRLEYDFPATRAYDENLGVSELRYVEDGVVWFFVVGAEKRAARSCCAVPLVGLRGGLLSEFVGCLEVGDWFWGCCSIIGCGFDFEGPEMSN